MLKLESSEKHLKVRKFLPSWDFDKMGGSSVLQWSYANGFLKTSFPLSCANNKSEKSPIFHLLMKIGINFSRTFYESRKWASAAFFRSKPRIDKSRESQLPALKIKEGMMTKSFQKCILWQKKWWMKIYRIFCWTTNWDGKTKVSSEGALLN